MSKTLRRFEVLLPRRFNDGRPVPNEVIGNTLIELRRQFGAVTCETQTLHGMWQHEGAVYRDELIRVFVDVADTPENRQFFTDFKENLKGRFEQLDIWLTSFLVDAH